MCDCDHAGGLRYVRRTNPDNSVHLCVQCSRCLAVVKLPQHGNRLLLKMYEVPPGEAIYEYIEPTAGGSE